MSDYVKATNFAVKDGLTTGDPAKRIKGTEIDVELTAISSAIASKADSNSPTLTGTPLAPTAVAGTSTTQIATTSFVATAVSSVFPSGGIIMWSGSIASIPSGWVLCDGSNGTPDLRDRFVVGAGSSYAVAATGGSKDAIVVSHTHTATSSVSDPSHNHTFSTYSGTGGPGTTAYYGTGSFAGTAPTSSSTTGISVSTSVASAGSSGTNANLPPYYALAFIMKS